MKMTMRILIGVLCCALFSLTQSWASRKAHDAYTADNGGPRPVVATTVKQTVSPAGFSAGTTVGLSFDKARYCAGELATATIKITGTCLDGIGKVTLTERSTSVSQNLPTGGTIKVSVPSAGSTYTYTVTIVLEGETSTSASADLAVVEIEKLQYSLGGGAYADVTATLYVSKGGSITFKAIGNPTGGWPSSKPAWSGSAGATGTGETKTVTFNTAGTCTVSAECGNTITANVTVVEVEKLQYSLNGGATYTDVTTTLFVPKGANVTFKAIANPAGTWPTGKPVWSGSAPGATGTGETKPITFSTAGTFTVTAECGNVPVTATVVAVELVSLTPDQGTVFNDGGTDPNTVAYAVPLAASGVVTVTATANPAGISETNLPSSWTMTGGTGTGKYSRTVSKTSSAITVVSCTLGTTTKTVKLYVYTASITSMPSLCAGGYSDAAHQGTISVRAQCGGKSIPNASVELVFASPLSSLGSNLKPSFASSTLTTDVDGNASTTLTSGAAVLPSASGLTYATANVAVKLGGYEVPSSYFALSIPAPNTTVNACDPTGGPVTELYLYGDLCVLVGEASFTRNGTTYNVTATHDLTWRFRFWASENAPADPENDDTYDFDGTVSSTDSVFPWLTEYGYIDYDGLDEDNGQRVAIYVTGTTPGWIWWYLDDADVLIEE